MDAHKLYVKYNSSTISDGVQVQQDVNTIQLARMMGIVETECSPLDEDTTLNMGTLTMDPGLITDAETKEAAPTAPNTPTAVQRQSSAQVEKLALEDDIRLESDISTSETKEAFPKEPFPSTPTTAQSKAVHDTSECLSDYIQKCDTLMVQHSGPRINALVRAVRADVDIKWVHSFASRVNCTGDIPSETVYETLRPESDRHVHIVNNNVIKFVEALHNVQPNKITTFAWTHNSKRAIHLQKLDTGLRQRFKNVKSIFSATILASIGLPMHELFKIKDYFANTYKWRFKNMTRDSLIKTTLRPKVTIQKIDEKLETNQLLKEYNNTETLFDVDVQDHQQTVEMFMFKHWYSYPTGQEMKTMIERATFNLNKWTGESDFLNEVRKKNRRHRRK